jgi:hypothetical protein
MAGRIQVPVLPGQPTAWTPEKGTLDSDSDFRAPFKISALAT